MNWREILDLPENRVRVITEFMGGGFGAKFGAGNPGAIAAQLSRTAGAPVRLMLTRKDEHLSSAIGPIRFSTSRSGRPRTAA